MTQEEKKLLIKDLCSRVSNGGYVKVSVESTVGFGKDCVVVDIHNLSNFVETTDFNLENVKPYLRPMESMTTEERLELSKLSNDKFKFYLYSKEPEIICFERYNYLEGLKVLDLLNSHYLDYRGLIPKGLALPATEGMYKLPHSK